jgi:plastocyanin
MPRHDKHSRFRILAGAVLCGGCLLTAHLTLAGTLDPADATPSQVATTSNPAADKVAKVDIDNFDFAPMSVTVVVGTTITWTNHDDVPHTVLSADNPVAFKSPPLDTDDAYSFTFTKPGTYKYFCSVHPKMVGIVVVKQK